MAVKSALVTFAVTLAVSSASAQDGSSPAELARNAETIMATCGIDPPEGGVEARIAQRVLSGTFDADRVRRLFLAAIAQGMRDISSDDPPQACSKWVVALKALGAIQ